MVVANFGHGRDEMNLVEFPLTPVTDRFLDGRKTVVLADKVWDRDRREYVQRQLAISGSDHYGLPTAKDEDVLLGCLQLSSLMGFRTREVHFSRYELLKLLRWRDQGNYYSRLATSLRRWKGVTIYSNRAFYDHGRKSWVNRDFGILDNLYIYEREESERAPAPASSWFVWNEVLFESFQAGYLKQLDWDLYCRLTDPVAKRLYRLLDKRFYHGDEVVFDLHELAFRKIRVCDRYNTAQIKRALASGIRELEALWELRPLPLERRYRKKGTGQWEVVFQRKRRPRREAAAAQAKHAAVVDLETELIRREIGPAMAEELVAGHPTEHIQTMLELFDWYNARGQERGPGFLVNGIRNPDGCKLPKGFESSSQRAARQQAENSRKRAVRELARRQEAKQRQEDKKRLESFTAFWNGLDAGERQAFEQDALEAANPLKRSGYLRAQHTGSPMLETYRQVILVDHFHRRNTPVG